MSIAVTTSSTAVSPAAARATVGKRDSKEADLMSGSGADAIALAFEALLSASPTVGGLRRTGTATAMSSSQMFEPANPDAHARRRSALQEDYRTDVSNRSPTGRFDRTSVEVRGARKSNRTGGAASRTIAMVSRSPVTELGPQAPTGASDPSDKAGGLGTGRGGDSPANLGIVSNGAASRAGHAATSISPTSTAGLRSAAPASAAGMGAVAVSDASKVVQAQSLAHRVGQLLAAGRAGQADAARTVPNPSTSVEAQSTAFEKTAASRSMTHSPSEATGSSRPGSGGDTRLDASGKSPFDQLVRSIRLNSGARHSSARILLHPPELGRIDVELRMVDERVQIDVRTETTAARQLVQERATELAAALERQGIYVERFDITADPSGGDGDSGATVEQNARQHADDRSPGSNDVPGETLGDATGLAAEPEVAIVSKTRLDIRV